MLTLWIAAAAWWAAGASAPTADFYAAPGGSPAAEGTREEPLDLATALDSPQRIGAGDTLWLLEGTYRGGFASRLRGQPGRPVTIRAVPGKRVTIDGQGVDGADPMFYVRGDWSVFWGLEFTCSDTRRSTDVPGSWPPDMQRGGIDCRASHVKFINLLVHDLGTGVGSWADGDAGEIYGCLIYNNGWSAPDRGHGHGIYAQNQSGRKRIEENVVFNQFGNGIQCYGSPDAFLRGFHVKGNVVFGNGSPRGESNVGILVGGETPVQGAFVAENFVYRSSLRLGYGWGPANADAVVTGNYVVGSMHVREFDRFTFEHNTVVSADPLLGAEWLDQLDATDHQWDENQYFKAEERWAPFTITTADGLRGATFSTWQEETGFDATSRYHDSYPAGAQVFVRPNRYESHRAHLIVFNWDHQESVQLDLDSVLPVGQRFAIVSAQRFFGPPVVEGIYRGRPVSLPMEPTPAAVPMGMPDHHAPTTEPGFGVFVVLPSD